MRAWRQLIAKTVLVNLHSGRAFRGALVEVRGDLLMLKNAALIEPGSDPIPVDGTVVVERRNVDFIQVIGG